MLHSEHFLVAVRPAEPREIVDKSLRQIAVLLVLHDAHRSVPLRQPFAVGAEDHGTVGEFRQLRPERLQNVDLTRRAVHMIVTAAPVRHERLGYFLVPSAALYLEKRTFIPVEPEPAHRVEDRLHRGFGRALEVGVLDAQDELAAVLSRVCPGEKSGPRPTDMEVAGRARSKTGSDHRRAWNRRIVRDGIAAGPAARPRRRFATLRSLGRLAQR